MDISKGSSTCECGTRNLRKLFIGVEYFLGLSVETSRVDVRIINTIFLSSSHTELKLEQDVELREFLHVFLADGNVFLQRFLRKIKHVRREKRLSIELVEFFVGLDKTIHPRQPGLLAMVSVKNDRDSVECGNFVHVLGGRDASCNGSLVVGVVSCLSGNELTASLGECDHDGTSVLLGGFHARVDGIGSDNIDSGNGKSLLLGVVKKVNKRLSGDNTRLDRRRQLCESLWIK
jgi:hypothetical protein